MIARCTNPYSVSYQQYGGQGISVCKRWRHFKSFLADMGQRPPGTSLDRIDNAKGYEPWNCRWASRSEQNRNREPFVRGKVRKPVVIPKSPRPRGRPPVENPETDRYELRLAPDRLDRYRAAAERAGKALAAWMKGVLDRAAKRS